MTNLILEVNSKQFIEKLTIVDNGATIVMTPPINENYWSFRVKLFKDQAILGFPKFFTIGIGFAQEVDWNTNLPYSSTAQEIYNHIKHNKKYDEITDEQCLDAIRLIQEAVETMKESRGENK